LLNINYFPENLIYTYTNSLTSALAKGQRYEKKGMINLNKKFLKLSLFFMAFLMSSAPFFAAVGQQPFVGGRLVVPLSADIHVLTPFEYGTTYEGYVLGHMYDSLVQYDVDNQPQPVLCESWWYNSTYEKWIFTLRENTFWHDGEVLDTADVYFTWTTFLDDPTISRRSWLYNYVDEITVLNATAIQVEFTYGPKPQDVLIEFADAWIVPEHLWNDKDVTTYANIENPIGSGPFVFEEWSPGQYFRLSRNANYYLDGPWVEEKILQIVPTIEAGFYALSVGELETLTDVPPELELVAQNDPNIDSHEYLDDYIMYLGVNHRRWPNNVTAFRQAILQGIDRDAIIEIAGFGRGLEAPASMSLPWGPYYDDTIPDYAYDVLAANATLDSIGITDSDADGYREGNGTELTFRLLVSGEYQQSVDTATIIASYMRKLGIEVIVEPLLWANVWKRIGGLGGTYAEKYDYDWCFAGWVSFWSDMHPNWAAWMFNEDLKWGSDNYNIPGWEGAYRTQVTDLTNEIMTETDEGVVLTKLDQVQHIIAQELPYIPVRVMGRIALYRNDSFTGWVKGPTTGLDNWESWLAVHLVEPEEGDGFQVMTAVIAVGFLLVGSFLLKRRRRLK